MPKREPEMLGVEGHGASDISDLVSNPVNVLDECVLGRAARVNFLRHGSASPLAWRFDGFYATSTLPLARLFARQYFDDAYTWSEVKTVRDPSRETSSGGCERDVSGERAAHYERESLVMEGPRTFSLVGGGIEEASPISVFRVRFWPTRLFHRCRWRETRPRRWSLMLRHTRKASLGMRRHAGSNSVGRPLTVVRKTSLRIQSTDSYRAEAATALWRE